MVRICCISDTHEQHEAVVIPPCDVLVHAGDLSYMGEHKPIARANEWFGRLKRAGTVKEVVCIAGNHDWGFQKNPSFFRAIMTNCVFLQDEPAEVMGLRFYGSPRTPFFCSWAFNEARGTQIARWWKKIPEDVQVLVTHGPPMGVLDTLEDGEHVGCEELKKRVDELKDLRLHAFGHIHSANAKLMDPAGRIFVNAAVCDEEYKPTQQPHVVDL